MDNAAAPPSLPSTGTGRPPAGGRPGAHRRSGETPGQHGLPEKHGVSEQHGVPEKHGVPEHRALSDRLPRPWLFPLLVFAADWTAILASWRLANAYYHRSTGWYSYIWFRDTDWYGRIARTWYAAAPHQAGVPQSTAFFPLYPATLRAASYLTGGSLHAAGLVVAVASGAAAITSVWFLADRIGGRWLADRTTLLVAFFPGAMTLALMYSEPLGIALAATALLAALNRRWILAGLLGLLGTAEHPTLIMLVPALGIAAIQAIREQPPGRRGPDKIAPLAIGSASGGTGGRPPERHRWKALAAPLLTPLGMLGYFAWIGHRYHDYGFWSQVERKYWGHHIDFGARMLRIFLGGNPDHRDPGFYVMVIALVALGAAGIALMLAARTPLPVTLFTLGIFASLILSAETGPTPRYVWALLGIFTGAAAKLPRWLYWPLLAAFAVLFCLAVGWWPNNPHWDPP